MVMSMNITIKQITNKNDSSLDIISKWLYEWWGKDEGYLYEEVECYVKHAINKDSLPMTFGLFIDNKIIGLYHLIYNDLDIRVDIYPMVADIYILKEYRGKGYGKILINDIVKRIKSLNFPQFYLYTSHHNLYEKFGFEFVEEIDTYRKSPRIQRLYTYKVK